MIGTPLHIVLLHHPSDEEFAPSIAALRSAFSSQLPDDLPTGTAPDDPWDWVMYSECQTTELIESTFGMVGATRILVIVLAGTAMVENGPWKDWLSGIADWLANENFASSRSSLIYSSGAGVARKLPANARRLHVDDLGSAFGERSLFPAKMVLQSLNRIRKLLDWRPCGASNGGKFFISHAKRDGVFLARSIRTFLDELKGFDAWYDAHQIAAGEPWEPQLLEHASSSVFLAIRTPGYDLSNPCAMEFHAALSAGVPIVVVDAYYQQRITSSTLPYAHVPNVKVVDGNLFRVIEAALHEHIRVLLLDLMAKDACDSLGIPEYRVWPRIPAFLALKEIGEARNQAPLPIVVADPIVPSYEFDCAREFLAANSWVRLETLTTLFQTSPNPR